MPQLLNIRTGPGAVILPPSPAPQLTSISVRYPKNRDHKPGRKTDGLHRLLRDYLPRLKYYNPAVRIEVDNPSDMSAASMLRLQFESTEPFPLRATKKERSAEERKRDELRKRGFIRPSEISPEPASPEDTTSNDTITQREPLVNDDEVVLKSLPAANPSSPSTVSPPNPIYTRTATFASDYRKPHQIRAWMRKKTHGEQVPVTQADQQLSRDIKKHEEQSAETRERMKEVSAKIKDEQAALAKAQKSAEAAAAGNT